MSLRNRQIFTEREITAFVTTTLMNFEKVFSISDSYYDIILDSLKFVLKKYNAYLLAYVFMPNHIHLILHIDNVKNLSSLMRDFKKYTSTKIRQKLEEDNMQNILGRLKTNAEGKKNQVFKLWMDRFDDVMIYTESVLWTKIQYIHNNPVRKELVEKPEDWKYSSYKSYIEDNDGLIEIVNQF